MAYIKNQEITKVGKDVEKRKFPFIIVENINGSSTMENRIDIIKKIKS